MSLTRHAFDPTTGRSILIAHRVEYDMFRFVPGFLALSLVTVSLQGRANDVAALETDDVIYFTDDTDRIDFEFEDASAGSELTKVHRTANDRSDATFEGWARSQILDAWSPREGLIRQHSSYRTRVVLNVDETGHVNAPVIVSTNASKDFHDSIQKAISSAVLRAPPKGEGQGIVIDFYADRVEKP
jgi:hypothetical protein